MAVRSLRSVRPFIWIPPSSSPTWKIMVFRNDGTIDDITDYISKCEVEDYVTESVGAFSFEIFDPNEVYASAWTGNEVFVYYKDYAITATTLVFRGRIEKPSKRGHKLVVKGKSESSKLLTKTVTAQYTNTECSVILKDLFANNATWATTTGVETSTVFITVDWYDKPMLDCVQELCSSAGYDFYVNASLDAQFFEVGSRQNETDAIVHDRNMLELKEFTPDLTQIRNIVRVYGAEVNGIQAFYTAKKSSTDSPDYGYNTDFGERVEIIRNDSVTTYEQARDIATARVNEKIVPPQTGEIVGFLLATVLPGEQVRLSSPADEIQPGFYSSTGYKDTLDVQNGRFTTNIYINRTPRKISHIIKSQIQSDNKKISSPINQFSLDFSYDFQFDINSGSHTSTEITDGALRLVSGQSSGQWVSDERELSENVVNATMKIRGSSLNNVRIYVSGNNGLNYQELTDSQNTSISSAIGKNLRVKVQFLGEAEVDSLSVQYSYSSSSVSDESTTTINDTTLNNFPLIFPITFTE